MGLTNFCANAARLKKALVTASQLNTFSLIAFNNSGASRPVIFNSSSVSTVLAIPVMFLGSGSGKAGRGGSTRETDASRKDRTSAISLVAVAFMVACGVVCN